MAGKGFFERISSRERRIVGLVVVLGVLALLYMFAVTPMLQGLALVRSEIDVKEAELDDILKTQKDAKELLEQHGKLLARARSDIPRDFRRSWFSEQLETMADKSNMMFSSISIEEREAEMHEELRAQIRATSSWEGLAQFLYEMQNAGEVFDVREMRNLRMRGVGTLEAEFVVVSIFLKEL